MANFCTNCGAQNPDGTKFCTSCGTPIVQAAPVEQPVQEPVYQQPVQQPQYQQPQYQQPQYQQPAYQQPQGYPQQPQYQQPYPTGYTGFSETPKKSKKGLIAVIAIILVLGLAAIVLFVWPGFLNGSGKLDGTWLSNYGEEMVLDGGKGTLDGDDFTYSLSGDKITMKRQGMTITYNYELEGDKLTFYIEDDDDAAVTFTRKGAAPSGDNSGGDRPNLPGFDEDELEGRWEDEYGLSSYEFDDGDCKIGALGMNFDGTYEVDGDHLTITYTVMGYDTTLEYTFEVNGDTLTLTDTNGSSADYTRK